MSSPARRAWSFRSPTTLNTYGGSRLMRGKSMRNATRVLLPPPPVAPTRRAGGRRRLSRGHAVRLPPAGQRHRPESTPPGRGAHDHDVLEHAAVTGLVAERRPRPPARGGPARPRLAGGLRRG